MPKKTAQEIIDRTADIVISLAPAVEQLNRFTKSLDELGIDNLPGGGRSSTKKKKRGQANGAPVNRLEKFFKEESKEKKADQKDRKKDRLEQKKEGRGAFKELQRVSIAAVSDEGSGKLGFLKWFKGAFDLSKIKDWIFPKTQTKTEPKAAEGGWLRKLLGPIAVILLGLGAFFYGLMTDGPLKGFMKLLAQGGIMGGFKWLGRILMKPITMFKDGIKKIFSKEAIKKILQVVPKRFHDLIKPVMRFFFVKIPNFFKGLFAKVAAPVTKFLAGGSGGILGMLGKVGGFLAKNLKFIPLLGGLISFGFAISRFKKGDWIGGTIDVVSGVLGMVPPGPWSAVTVPLAIGLSVLNAILDAKAGGATGKQTGAKTDMLKKWAAGFFSLLWKLPLLDNIYNLAQGFIQGVKGNWKAAANHFMYSVPIVGTLLNWFSIGGFKDPEGEPITGDRGSFFKKIIDWITAIPPLQTIIAIGKGIGAAFKGEWAQAARYFMYSIPIIGTVLDWFGVGANWGKPDKSDMPQKDGFLTRVLKGALAWGWGTVKWILGKVFWPIKKILQWTGFLDDMPAGKAEDVVASAGGSGKKISPAEMIKRSKYGAIKQYAGTWKSIGSVGRWVARKFLDEETENALDIAAGLKDDPGAGLAGKPSSKKAESATDQIYSAATSAVSTITTPFKTAFAVGGKLMEGDLGGAFMEGVKGLGQTLGHVWDVAKNGFKLVGKAAGVAWDGIKGVAGLAWSGIKGAVGLVGKAGSLAWDGIKGAAGLAWKGIKGAAGLAWKGIKGYIGLWGKAAGLAWKGIKGAASLAWKGLKASISGLGKAAGWAWKGIKGIASGVWSGIKGAVGLVGKGAKLGWKGIKGAAGLAWKGVKGYIGLWGKAAKAAWSGIKSIAGGVWSGIKSAVGGLGKAASAAWGGIKSVAGGLWSGIKSAFGGAKKAASAAWGGIKSVASSLWEGTKGFFSHVGQKAKKAWDGIKGAAAGLWSGIKGGFSKLWSGAKEALGKAKELAGKAWDSVKGGYNDLKNAYQKEGVKGVMKETGKKLMNAGKSIADGAKSLWNKATGWLSWSPHASEYITKAGKSIAGDTKKLAEQAPDFTKQLNAAIKNITNSVVKTASSAWSRIRTITSNTWRSIRWAIYGTESASQYEWKQIKSAAARLWSGIKKLFTDLYASLQYAARYSTRMMRYTRSRATSKSAESSNQYLKWLYQLKFISRDQYRTYFELSKTNKILLSLHYQHRKTNRLLTQSAHEISKLFGKGRGGALEGGAWGVTKPTMEIKTSTPISVKVVSMPVQEKKTDSVFEQTLLSQNQEFREELINELKRGEIVSILNRIDSNTRQGAGGSSPWTNQVKGGGGSGSGNQVSTIGVNRESWRVNEGFQHGPS